METFIFGAGIFVSLLFIIGAQMYQQEIAAWEKHEEKKKSNNEYRTKEEYISYPE